MTRVSIHGLQPLSEINPLVTVSAALSYFHKGSLSQVKQGKQISEKGEQAKWDYFQIHLFLSGKEWHLVDLSVLCRKYVLGRIAPVVQAQAWEGKCPCSWEAARLMFIGIFAPFFLSPFLSGRCNRENFQESVLGEISKCFRSAPSLIEENMVSDPSFLFTRCLSSPHSSL